MTRLPPRVVLDTNVVLAALVFAHGRVSALRGAWQEGRFMPLVSRVTVSELMRVLSYPKFKLSGQDRQELLADYLPYCSIVDMPKMAPPIPPCRDPFDRPFLELAVVGSAGYLVTGDQDLLTTKLKRCEIVTPEEFLRVLATKPG